MQIKPKRKRCKSTGKAHGFETCGKDVYRFRFGMCESCFYNWRRETEEGQKYFTKQTAWVTRKAVKNVEKREAQEKRERTSKRITWKNELQKSVNHIARLIDKGQPCTATRLNRGKWNGGHVFGVGGNNTTRFNLHNIHIQCVHSNKWQNDDDKMKLGIRRVYSDKYGEFVTYLQSTPSIHYNNMEYHELTKKAREIARRLVKLDRIYSTECRIELRNDINKELGIYDFEFCVF